MNIVECIQVSKKFGCVTVLDNVNLCVKENSIYGLIGINGAGKSTLLKSMLDLLNTDSGEITLLGKGKREHYIAKKEIGSMLEMSAFYPDLTARQNLEYFRVLFGINDKTVCQRALEKVQLEDDKRKKFKHFSLGMKQRLGIALAIMNHPKLVILDEPLNGLDPIGIAVVRDLVRDINANEGTTFLISSHNLPELHLVATQFGIMDKGKIIMQLSQDQMEKKCKNNILVTVKDVTMLEKCISSGKLKNVIRYERNKIVIPNNDKTEEKISNIESMGVKLAQRETHELSLEEFFRMAIAGEIG